MRFARLTFLVAGIYGLAVLAPQYFLEDRIGRENPPEIAHPEFFYGFLGVAIAWQLVFLLIAVHPVRFRPIMAAAVVEKFSFAAAAAVLFAKGRINAPTFTFGMIDLAWGLLFITAWRRTAAKALETK